MLTFQKFYEIANFGFQKEEEKVDKLFSDQPIDTFDFELMMNYLEQKKLGLLEANGSHFIDEVVWGDRAGAIKVEVDTGKTFYIKRLNFDLEGTPQWITKKLFQLNRDGLGGFEDYVANEIFEHINIENKKELDYPKKEIEKLNRLVEFTCHKIRQVAKPMFTWKKTNKISENIFQIVFEILGGVGGASNTRIEQNITQFAFNEANGILQVQNYNIESTTGSREWKIAPLDLDLKFFPTQPREEIADCLMVHFKYY